MPLIDVSRRDDSYWLTLNRPEALNALSLPLIEEMIVALAAIDPRGIPLVLTGAGRAFSAGADLKGFLAIIDDPGALHRYFSRLSDLLCAIHAYEGVTVAAINGFAVAGGLELACVCDLAVASETAKFSDGHVKVGLHPGGGASFLLRRLLGERMARWLLLSGETIDARTALQAGLVNQVVPAGELIPTVTRLVGTLPPASREATRRTKRLMADDLPGIIARECDSLVELLQLPETRAHLQRFAARSEKKA